MLIEKPWSTLKGNLRERDAIRKKGQMWTISLQGEIKVMKVDETIQGKNIEEVAI